MQYGNVISIKKGFAKRRIFRDKVWALIPDTNILLYLVSKDDYFEFLVKLELLICNNHLALVLPEQVINEFYNNLEKVIERKKENIRVKIKEAMQLKDYLSPLSQDKGEHFSAELDLMINQEEKIFLRNLYRKVTCLEFLFNYRADIIKTTDGAKVKAANMALEKIAPFFGDKGKKNNKDVNKLSMGDAIIFLSITSYLKDSQYKENYFLTENADDFCKSGNKRELHENLLVKAQEVSMKYSINIAEFINKVIEEVGTTDGLTKIQSEVVQKVEETVISKCPFCKDPEAQLTGYYGRSMFGLTWWEQCTKCGARWDTGEEFEC